MVQPLSHPLSGPTAKREFFAVSLSIIPNSKMFAFYTETAKISFNKDITTDQIMREKVTAEKTTLNPTCVYILLNVPKFTANLYCNCYMCRFAVY